MDNSKRKLQFIMQNAIDNCQYYKRVYKNKDILDSESCPILRKVDIIANKAEIINMHYANSLLKECQIHISSGSAGAPIEIYWHHNDEIRLNLAIWRLRLKFYGIRPSDKFCTLHTTTYSWTRIADYQDIIYSADGTMLSLCKLFLDDEDLYKYYHEIMKFKPVWLFFQPSILIKLTNFMLKNKLPVPDFIKYIEFTGEALSPLAIKYVGQYYKCNYANMYGTTETGTISYMCPYGHMHVLSDNVFLEIEPDHHSSFSTTGKAIVTSLNNTVFPLIRYDVGDIVSIEHYNDCKCGLQGLIMKNIIGRENKCVKLRNGQSVNEAVIISLFDRVNTLSGHKIKEFKAVISIKSSTIYFVIYIEAKEKNWEKQIVEQIENIINERFQFLYEVSFSYEPLCIDNSGKFSVLEVI